MLGIGNVEFKCRSMKYWMVEIEMDYMNIRDEQNGEGVNWCNLINVSFPCDRFNDMTILLWYAYIMLNYNSYSIYV